MMLQMIYIEKKNHAMIIDFSQTIDSYNEIIGVYGDFGYSCPRCKGNRLIRYASYNRNVLSYEGDALECRMVRILRLRCKNCGSTHAILTADMVPFLAYSLPCILAVLQAAFGKNGSITETKRKAGISYQVIYRFLRILSFSLTKIHSLLYSQKIIHQDDCVELREMPTVLLSIPPPLFLHEFYSAYDDLLFMVKRSTADHPFYIGGSN